ncbi:MAG: helix-turn-helix transcriptional regulator [Tissierellia bacterium]|nr:helix-turn-helix transcriptional regulator [Tissierellia bacterium]
MARDQLQTLTEPMYYILLSLYRENYGYEIMESVKEISNNRVEVGPGTLYPILARFEKEGIIKLIPSEGRRKNYIITDEGKDLVAEEINRLKNLLTDGELYASEERKSPEEEKAEEVEKEKPVFKRPEDEFFLY